MLRDGVVTVNIGESDFGGRRGGQMDLDVPRISLGKL